MKIGLYKVLQQSNLLRDALQKGLPDYFGSKSKWKFAYKQPSMAWRDSVDSDDDGDLVVEKVNENLARLKLSAVDKKGQSTSTIVGTLTK